MNHSEKSSKSHDDAEETLDLNAKRKSQKLRDEVSKKVRSDSNTKDDKEREDSKVPVPKIKGKISYLQFCEIITSYFYRTKTCGYDY